MSAALFLEAAEAPATVYLRPGQVYAAAHAAYVSAIVGPSVAVCLWDAVARVGGMNHYLLPDGDDVLYGNQSMPRLVEEMTKRGALVVRTVARVFGGAGDAIGTQNVEVARQFLEELAIPVRAERTGGARGRKVLFYMGTGSAYVKEIQR